MNIVEDLVADDLHGVRVLPKLEDIGDVQLDRLIVTELEGAVVDGVEVLSRPVLALEVENEIETFCSPEICSVWIAASSSFAA